MISKSYLEVGIPNCVCICIARPQMGEAGEIGVSDDPRAQRIFEGFRIESMNMRDATSGAEVWRSNSVWDKTTFSDELEIHIPVQFRTSTMRPPAGRDLSAAAKVPSQYSSTDQWFGVVVPPHCRLQASILGCRAISREITFSSVELIDKFRLEQRIFLHGQCIEEWFFDFGTNAILHGERRYFCAYCSQPAHHCHAMSLLLRFNPSGFVIPNSTNTWQQVIEADEGNMSPADVLSGQITIETSFYDDQMIVSKSRLRVFYD